MSSPDRLSFALEDGLSICDSPPSSPSDRHLRKPGPRNPSPSPQPPPTPTPTPAPSPAPPRPDKPQPNGVSTLGSVAEVSRMDTPFQVKAAEVKATRNDWTTDTDFVPQTSEAVITTRSVDTESYVDAQKDVEGEHHTDSSNESHAALHYPLNDVEMTDVGADGEGPSLNSTTDGATDINTDDLYCLDSGISEGHEAGFEHCEGQKHIDSGPKPLSLPKGVSASTRANRSDAKHGPWVKLHIGEQFRYLDGALEFSDMMSVQDSHESRTAVKTLDENQGHRTFQSRDLAKQTNQIYGATGELARLSVGAGAPSATDTHGRPKEVDADAKIDQPYLDIELLKTDPEFVLQQEAAYAQIAQNKLVKEGKKAPSSDASTAPDDEDGRQSRLALRREDWWKFPDNGKGPSSEVRNRKVSRWLGEEDGDEK